MASNLNALGASVEICGVVGDDSYGGMLLGMLKEKGINTRFVVKDPDRPTILKTRIIAHKQQVVRVDREDTRPLEGEGLARMKAHLREAIANVDAMNSGRLREGGDPGGAPG